MEANLGPVVLSSGVPLLDTDGNPVHAHGGHMLFEDGYYYWFGENRNGRKRVSCYRSADLKNWEWRNDVLTLDSPVKPVYHPTSLELEPMETGESASRHGAVIERPKVLYNSRSYLYVGDRWDPADYHASTYVFLPLSFPSEREMRLEWCDSITVDSAAGERGIL